MSNTMMPFLYQTRTLCRTSLKGGRFLYKPPRPIPYRCFASSIQRRSAIDRDAIPTTIPKPPKKQDDGPFASNSRGGIYEEDASSADNLENELDSIEWKAKETVLDEELTSHIRRVEFGGPKITGNEEDSIGFEDDLEDPRKWSEKPEIDELTNKRAAKKSTITVAERFAFQKIFSDIFKRSHSLEPLDEEQRIGPRDKSSIARARKLTESILSASVAGREKPVDQSAAIEQFPPALRAAAARAMSAAPETIDEQEEILPEEPGMTDEELLILRKPELERIEALMRQAPTDLELWNVMEREVFTLIPKLGLEVPAVGSVSSLLKAPPKRKAKFKKAQKLAKLEQAAKDEANQEQLMAQEETTQSSEAALVGAEHDAMAEETTPNEKSEEASKEVSPLTLYGPLYPEFCLLGLRLMDRSFTKSSLLALSILPRIKSLGFISHVLGASTQFYNELLQIYRYRYDDFRGMDELLQEMDHAALEFDQETYKIISDVYLTQKRITHGSKGYSLQNLWKLPEFKAGNFYAWRKNIADVLDEQVESKARSERDR